MQIMKMKSCKEEIYPSKVWMKCIINRELTAALEKMKGPPFTLYFSPDTPYPHFVVFPQPLT